MDSPAFSVTSDFSDFTDEELDHYFATYVPLSNLPTPPPAKKKPVGAGGLGSEVEAKKMLVRTPELEVYAQHLSNRVPPNVATHRPSIPTIQNFLSRANLPIEIIAFASCILDALSQRFATSWRTCCLPPNPPNFGFDPKISFRHPPAMDPEIVVLSALAIALDFLEDRPRPNSHWAKIEGGFLFTERQIEATKVCILKDIDYGLFRITEGMVMHMLRVMQQAGEFSRTDPTTIVQKVEKLDLQLEPDADKDARRPKLSLDLIHLQGTAVWVNGLQTPEPSP
ncbi:uncharacterized protein BDR25DRAFT_312717 [Lindgomyces ingoldianus]|uniref:Uncharacterized protein n=1 Tax=Lindgomyces ingoldianus TaxID=673940 RepID=A0ACB6R3C5_9PLEO|nr:uncharacterized protein BDR25DRAFT_312717 [Lindgomyces ingoldianus]KAF2472822.1 hypothetical protein BDR25DRAFT_312717 [Lindgomyces ingoldianus]